MLPGSYHIVWASDEEALVFRRKGYRLRDTFYVLGPGKQVRLAQLFQLPLSEPTLVKQVLTTGTGALNIDACRVASDMSEFYSKGTGKPRSGMGHARGYGMGDGFGGDRANPPHILGRWPGNLVFVHGAECTLSSTKVPSWECSQDCPVLALDSQSGVRKSGRLDQANRKAGNGVYNDTFHGYSDPKIYEATEGGASRFYPQFGSDAALLEWLKTLIGVSAVQ